MAAEPGVEAIGAGGGNARVRALVEQDRDAVVRARGPEPRVRRRAQRAAPDRVGPQRHGAHAVADRLLEVGDHGVGIVARHQRGADEPRRRVRAEVREPAVVRAGIAARALAIDRLVVDEIGRVGREQHGGLDAARVHLGEVSRGRLCGCERVATALGGQAELDVGGLGDGDDGLAGDRQDRRRG
jgi:hypothetical protein